LLEGVQNEVKIETSGQMWNVIIPLVDVQEVGLIQLSWLGYNVVFMTHEGLGRWHIYADDSWFGMLLLQLLKSGKMHNITIKI
jgi:hypothetical protein